MGDVIMKSTSVLLVLFLLVYPSTSGGLELVVGAVKLYGVAGRGSPHVVNLWNTDTDAVAPGDMIPIYFRDDLSGVAMAPDRRLYFAECSERVPEAGTGHEICVPTIKRVEITVAPGGGVSHGPEETVYRAATPFTVDQFVNELSIHDIAIRRLDDAGNYRVYFSTGGCGGCDAVPRIYYLDDAGTPHLYYTVPRDAIGVSSCEGLAGYWSGNFGFDAAGELYLSSGNHCPAGLFHVPGASADGVTGTPARVGERECGGLQAFIVDAPTRVYFVGDSFGPTNYIYEWNPETDVDSVLLEIPLTFIDPPLGPGAGTWLQDIDKMVPHVEPGGGPFRTRGPSAPGRAVRLPGAEARMPPRPLARVQGSLSDRLPIPPRPDSKATTPDLVMAGLETGRLLVQGRAVSIPFRVFVRNNGTTATRPFDIAVTAKLPGAKKPVEAAFAVHGQDSRRRPQLNRLGIGEVMALGGLLTFEYPEGTAPGVESVAITAEVDRCPDRFFGLLKGGACRIQESNETNNRMTIELQIPRQ
jgi:hypothetical protein